MKSEGKRVAIYARVSTDRHKCRECRHSFRELGTNLSFCPKCRSAEIDRGQTPETQLVALRDYADSRGFAIVEEFIDAGVSGSKDSRPALNRLMIDAQRRRFDVVLVARFDRFARSTRHLVLALEEFQTLGVDFISLSESIDTSTPMGRMVFTIIGAVGELERSLIRERVLLGLARVRKSGRKLGRPRVHVDASAVRKLRSQGFSWQKVADTLGISRGSAQRVALELAVREGGEFG
jgi:DNA invertase Pin-like site-specific DNA recombinase